MSLDHKGIALLRNEGVTTAKGEANLENQCKPLESRLDIKRERKNLPLAPSLGPSLDPSLDPSFHSG